MTTTGKVFLSCFFGGGIGALVALSLWQPIWWLGMLVGGLVGYISYEFKKIIAAIPVAFQKATSKRARVRWRAFGRSWLGYTCISSTMMFGLCLVFTPIALLGGRGGQALAALFGISGLFMSIIMPLIIGWSVATCKQLRIHREDRDLRDLYRYNFFNVYFRFLPQRVAYMAVLVVEEAPTLVARIVDAVPLIVRSVWEWSKRFGWHLFVEIHSEVRLLCGLDAAIGAGVGYLVGHALIGALVGGILGIVNYELVSRRWLHLVPSR